MFVEIVMMMEIIEATAPFPYIMSLGRVMGKCHIISDNFTFKRILPRRGRPCC